MAQGMESQPLGFAVEDLPLEVFDLTDSGLEIESLTAGMGMPENGASVGHVLCSSCATCSVQRPTFTQETAF